MRFLILKARMRSAYPLRLCLLSTEGSPYRAPTVAKGRAHVLSWRARSQEALGGTEFTMCHLLSKFIDQIIPPYLGSE